MWNKITNPSNGKIYSLNSKKGNQLLKQYLQFYIKGGGDPKCIDIANFEKHDQDKSGAEKVLLPMKCDYPKNKKYCNNKKHGILLYHPGIKPNINEISIQQKIPFTPELEGPFQCNRHSESRDYLVTEVLDKDLFAFIIDEDKYDLSVFIQCCINIFKSIAELHRLKYGHFDIKPENIVVQLDSKTKMMTNMMLIDFGTAEQFIKTRYKMDGRLSTTQYMDPFVEVGGKLNGKTDVWSFGIVLLIFFIKTMDVVYDPEKQTNHDFHKFIHIQIDTSKQIPDILKPLLRKMLKKDSTQRIKCEDAITELKKTLKKLSQSSPTKKSSPKKSSPIKKSPKKSSPKKSSPKKSSPKKKSPKKSSPPAHVDLKDVRSF